jgi:hypothetical protein
MCTAILPRNRYLRQQILQIQAAEQSMTALCAVPDALVSFEDAQRLLHRDLPTRTGRQLAKEMYLARQRRLLDDNPPAWLSERIAAIAGEINRRRYAR